MTVDTAQDGLSLADAARVLGVSTRTLRRHIASGKVTARMVAGPRGQEYRVDLVGPSGAPIEPESDGQARQDSGAGPETGQGTALRPRQPETAQLVALVQQQQDMLGQIAGELVNLRLQATQEREHAQRLEADLQAMRAEAQRAWAVAEQQAEGAQRMQASLQAQVALLASRIAAQGQHEAQSQQPARRRRWWGRWWGR